MIKNRKRPSYPTTLAFVGATFFLLLYTAFALHGTPRQTGIIINHGDSHNLNNKNDLSETECSCNRSEQQDVQPQKPLVISHPSSAIGNETWQFDPTRDARAYGLNSQQCNAAFPGLFTEIDRVKTYQGRKWKVTPQDLVIAWKDDGAVRAAIIDQQVSSTPY
jgi:hypothetical protein